MIRFNVAPKLEEFRRQHGLEYVSLSTIETKHLQITQGTINKYLNGTLERISYATLSKLCKTFGTTPGELLEYMPDPVEE